MTIREVALLVSEKEAWELLEKIKKVNEALKTCPIYEKTTTEMIRNSYIKQLNRMLK